MLYKNLPMAAVSIAESAAFGRQLPSRGLYLMVGGPKWNSKAAAPDAGGGGQRLAGIVLVAGDVQSRVVHFFCLHSLPFFYLHSLPRLESVPLPFHHLPFHQPLCHKRGSAAACNHFLHYSPLLRFVRAELLPEIAIQSCSTIISISSHFKI